MNCLFVLTGDIRYDSRAKRSLSYLKTFFHVDTFHFNERPQGGLSYLKAILKLYLQVLKAGIKGHYDLIYVVGLPSLLISLIPYLTRRKILIYDARELYLLDSKGQSTYSTTHRVLEKIGMNFVNGVVAANQERMEQMKKYYGGGKKYTYLQNIPHVAVPPLKHEQLNAVPKIVYQGEIGKSRGIDKLIEACEKVERKIELNFVVPSYQKETLENLINQQIRHQSYQIKPFMPQEQLLKFLGECDLGYVAYEFAGPNNLYCEPNKLYEYAFAGLKMITSPQPKFKNVFSRYPIGACFSDRAWFSRNTELMAREIQLTLEMNAPVNAFENFRKEYSPEQEQSRLKNFIFQEILTGA